MRIIHAMNSHGAASLLRIIDDVSNTLLGAKQYATRNGYHTALKAEKVNGKWVDV